MRFFKATAIVALLFCALPALGHEEGEPGQLVFLGAHGDWNLYIQDYVNGFPDPWKRCSAATRDGWSELVLRLAKAPDGSFDTDFIIRNERWTKTFGHAVSARLLYDDGTESRSLEIGEGSGHVWLHDSAGTHPEVSSLFEDIAAHRTADLVLDSGEVLARFSLDGSRAATDALKSCITEVLGRDWDTLEARIWGAFGPD